MIKYPSQKNRSTLAIHPLRLEQAKKLAKLQGTTARLIVEKLIKDAIGEIKMTNKKKYYAYVQNNSGATDDVPLQTGDKRILKDYIRSRYGKGWTVRIMAVDIDGDGQSVMGEPYEVESFKLRG